MVAAQDTVPKKHFSDAIEDNSYFIEEAYNQENRVVQHIFNLDFRYMGEGTFISFTQEWPVFSYRHQFSYTIPYSFLREPHGRGIGDLMVNYRYQLTGKNSWICLAPRISVIFPTGNYDEELGKGSYGCQFNIPASKRLSDHWIIHLNAGFTYLPNTKVPYWDMSEIRYIVFTSSMTSINAGANLIWLADRRINFLLEYSYSEIYSSDPVNSRIKDYDMIISPGFRASIPLKNLEIVPGVSLPSHIYSDGPTRTSIMSAFFYLSLEHPF